MDCVDSMIGNNMVINFAILGAWNNCTVPGCGPHLIK